MTSNFPRFTALGLSLLLMMTVPGLALASPGDQDDDKPQSDREQHKIAPRIEIKGFNPNFNWVGLSGGFLGVGLSDLTPELLNHFAVNADGGVMINQVDKEGPASAAGLQVGDIITRAGEAAITSPSALARTVRELKEGDLLEIEYWRDGRLATTNATIVERDFPNAQIIDIGDLDLDLEPLMNLEVIGPEVMEQVQRSLEQVFDEGWQVDLEKHLEQIQDINIEGLEERMEALRERMQELEQRLEERYGEGKSSGKDV